MFIKKQLIRDLEKNRKNVIRLILHYTDYYCAVIKSFRFSVAYSYIMKGEFSLTFEDRIMALLKLFNNLLLYRLTNFKNL